MNLQLNISKVKKLIKLDLDNITLISVKLKQEESHGHNLKVRKLKRRSMKLLGLVLIKLVPLVHFITIKHHLILLVRL